jgi:hypothetical protein
MAMVMAVAGDPYRRVSVYLRQSNGWPEARSNHQKQAGQNNGWRYNAEPGMILENGIDINKAGRGQGSVVEQV